MYICDMYLPKDRTLTSQIHVYIKLDVGCYSPYSVFTYVHHIALSAGLLWHNVFDYFTL